MPLYRVRRERCIPVEIVVMAPSMQEAEDAAFASDKWEDGCAYWQGIETEELEDGDAEPALVVPDPVPVPDPKSVWSSTFHVLEETPWFSLEEIKARRFEGLTRAEDKEGQLPLFPPAPSSED